MFVPHKTISLIAILLAVSATATSETLNAESVFACRQVVDDTKRLACYDEKIVALQPSIATQPAAVPDVVQTKEDTFGKSDVKLNQKALKRKDKAELKRMTVSVTKVNRNVSGQLVIYLENGQIWRQNDSIKIRKESASTASIKKAAMGSFRMKLDNSRTFRAKRIK